MLCTNRQDHTLLHMVMTPCEVAPKNWTSWLKNVPITHYAIQNIGLKIPQPASWFNSTRYQIAQVWTDFTGNSDSNITPVYVGPFYGIGTHFQVLQCPIENAAYKYSHNHFHWHTLNNCPFSILYFLHYSNLSIRT